MTQQDIDDLDAQFSGKLGAAKVVRFADGREVTKISIDEYIKLRGFQGDTVTATAGTSSSRTSYASFSKD